MRTEQKLLFNFRSTHAPFIFKMTTTISPVDSQSESMSPTYASLHHYLSADKSLLTKDMETKFKSVLDNPHICHVQPYNDNSFIWHDLDNIPFMFSFPYIWFGSDGQYAKLPSYGNMTNIMVVKVFEYASTSKLYILIIIHAPSPVVILALLKTSDISLRFYLEQTSCGNRGGEVEERYTYSLIILTTIIKANIL